MARKVLKSLRDHYKDKRFSCPQGSDVIRANGEELAKLEAKDKDHYDVFWSYESLEKLTIDKDRAYIYIFIYIYIFFLLMADETDNK